MNSKKARTILGVEEDADAETVRRAYLRAVKRHPPERDPEGFREVRDAFEHLREPRFLAPSLSAGLPLLDEYWSETDLDRQEELAEQLLAEHGDHPDVRWLAFERADPEAAPDIARQSGDPHVLREAILTYPEAFSDAELVAFAESGVAGDCGLLLHLLERGLREAALAYAQRELEHGLVGLRLALQLIEHGERDQGRAMAEAWMETEARLVPTRWPEEGTLVLATQQLLALPDDFPDLVSRRAAGAIAMYDIPPVNELLAGLERGERRRARKLLKKKAPALFYDTRAQAALDRTFRTLDWVDGKLERFDDGKPLNGADWFFAVIGLLALIRVCHAGCGGCDSETPETEPSSPSSSMQTPAPERASDGEPMVAVTADDQGHPRVVLTSR